MAVQNEERLSNLLSIVREIEGSPEERRKALLSSASGVSIFHRLLKDLPQDQEMQNAAFSASDLLGA
jgi:hypothetical protein